MKSVCILLMALAVLNAVQAFVPSMSIQTSMSASSSSAQLSRRNALSQAVVGGAALMGAALPQVASAATKKPQVYETPGGVKYIVINEGSGPYARNGDYCIVEYTGFLFNGQVFDASNAPGRKPIAFKLGSRQVIPGWEEVILEMKQGGEVQMVVPPKLAYGDAGVCLPDGECLVPKGETLKYDLKLKRVAISP